MVPQPVVAVLLLFPVTKDSEAVKETGMLTRSVSCLSGLPNLSDDNKPVFICTIKTRSRLVKFFQPVSGRHISTACLHQV